jgi:F0F1-type ATP synthase membrane subunit b/b'
MAKHEVLRVLVDAEKNAAEIVSNAHKAAEKIAEDAQSEIVDIRKGMNKQILLHKSSLGEVLEAESVKMRVESQERIELAHAAIDKSMDVRKNDACSTVINVLEEM